MSHDAWMATCIARLTKVSQLDDAEYAPDVIHADIAQQECVETLWNWRLGSANRRKLYHYEDVVNAMMDAIRQCRSATSG